MKLLTPSRLSRRRALQSLGGVALIGLTRKSLASIGAVGRSAGGIGAGSGYVFAPNYNSSAAGTQMTSPATLDRYFTPADRTAAYALNSSADSYGWHWNAPSPTTYQQAPTIDTPANITTLVGAAVTAPPDGASTILAVEWPSGTARGYNPWTCDPPFSTLGVANPMKFYCCGYVYVPSTTNFNGNGIKWIQLTSHGTAPDTNDLFEVYGWNNPPYSYAGALTYVQQGDVNNGGGGSGPSGGMARDTWNLYEYFASNNLTAGSTDGSWAEFLNGVKVAGSNSWTFWGSTGQCYFNQGGIIPYFGGGGTGGATSNQFLCHSRMFQAFSSA